MTTYKNFSDQPIADQVEFLRQLLNLYGAPAPIAFTAQGIKDAALMVSGCPKLAAIAEEAAVEFAVVEDFGQDMTVVQFVETIESALDYHGLPT